ncbi:MAG TPA: hypothetical protein VG938_07710 [Verrucomicrobiae bacterium]|jgi:hypothetical protein|nr:hypothetical protein [Verrucomicrobiae bacterium]
MTCKAIFTILVSALLLPAPKLGAQSLSERFAMEPAGNKFGARETTLDFFVSHSVAEHQDFTGGRLGTGFGINHFFLTYIGAGLDTGIDKWDWPNHINGSVIFRYPIEKWSVAPYVFTGFGRQFHDTSQWTYHIAGGFDYRLNPKTGVFTDIGATIPDVSRDFMLWRLGLRFRF